MFTADVYWRIYYQNLIFTFSKKHRKIDRIGKNKSKPVANDNCLVLCATHYQGILSQLSPLGTKVPSRLAFKIQCNPAAF